MSRAMGSKRVCNHAKSWHPARGGFHPPSRRGWQFSSTRFSSSQKPAMAGREYQGGQAGGRVCLVSGTPVQESRSPRCSIRKASSLPRRERTRQRLAMPADGMDFLRNQATCRRDHSTNRTPMSPEWNCWIPAPAGSPPMAGFAEISSWGDLNNHPAARSDTLNPCLREFPGAIHPPALIRLNLVNDAG